MDRLTEQQKQTAILAQMASNQADAHRTFFQLVGMGIAIVLCITVPVLGWVIGACWAYSAYRGVGRAVSAIIDDPDFYTPEEIAERQAKRAKAYEEEAAAAKQEAKRAALRYDVVRLQRRGQNPAAIANDLRISAGLVRELME